MKEKRKPYKYNTVEVGDVVIIKKNPKLLSGAKGNIGRILHIWPKSRGFSVQFTKPIEVCYWGRDPQLTLNLTLKTSYLTYYYKKDEKIQST